MGHCYHHALSSVKKWGGMADDYLPLHQWFDESKAITADFRHRALRHHAEGIFMLERFFGPTITISSGRVVPVRLIGEQHVREDLGFIPSFADWVRCIRPEPWMGRAQPIHRDVDPFLDDPHIAVDQHHPHRKVAMFGHQARHDRQHMEAPEHHRRGDIELPARFGRRAPYLALRPRQIGQYALRLFQKRRARVGQRDRARRSMKEQRSEPRLERRDPARHRGRRAAEFARRGGKTALARDRDKHFHRQQPVHRLFRFLEQCRAIVGYYHIIRNNLHRGGRVKACPLCLCSPP